MLAGYFLRFETPGLPACYPLTCAGKANKDFSSFWLHHHQVGAQGPQFPEIHGHIAPIPPKPQSWRAEPPAESRDSHCVQTFSSSPVSLMALSCMFRCTVHLYCHSGHGYLTEDASLEGNQL